MLRILRIPILSVIVLLSACNLPRPTAMPAAPTSATVPTAAASSPTAGATVSTQPASAAQSPAPPAHLIQIRVVNGKGEFYNRVSKATFVPRGMNYIRLGRQTKEDGSSAFGHSLFDPDKYDSARVAADLQKMHQDGYNVVRVFLSPDTMGTPAGGLSAAYMANVADLLERARLSDMQVMFTLDWIPGGKYGVILNRDCCDTFALMNANFLPAAGLEANRVFFQDFAKDLTTRKAAVDHIWSYELRNEMFYDGDQPPLSFTSGTVTTANGKTYDMSSADDKRRMIEENNVYWLDSVRAAILEVDPTALVSAGFFVPQQPNPARIGDPRLVVSAPAIWQSQLEFVDLHAYPGFELNLLQHVQNFGVGDMQAKPIVMGEFGGEISRFPSIQAAAQTLVAWQVESCKYGFDGWLFWTWDLHEQPDFFNALMQDGAINGALAPVLRPDPCKP